MSAQISAAKAKEYINNYRKGLPPGSLRSAWIDRSFIDAVLALDRSGALDGVRIYLARFTEDVSQGSFSAVAGSDTIIIVPTQPGSDGTSTDVQDAYYDYAHVCPPHCDGDEGD
ncbi:hypothetical protein [Ferruginibacter sp.]